MKRTTVDFMLMPCHQILENEYLIAALRSKDAVREGDVYNCLETLFHRTLVVLLVRKREGLPGTDVQKMIAEEAFNDAFMVLVEKAREGKFTAEGTSPEKRAGSVSYFYPVLWNKFQNALKRRHNRNMYSFAEDRVKQHVELSQDIPAYNSPGGMEKVVQAAIGKLEGKCAKYMRWQYSEGKSTDEIIGLSADAPGTVKKDMANCRKKLKEKIQETYGIGF